MPVLVAGPPCGGKSRFAKESATSGQLVLDFDALMESRTGSRFCDDPLIVREVRAEWASLLPSADWVVWTAPRKVERARFARQFAAAVVVVMASEATCLERAEAERPAAWAEYVRTWFRQFESSSRPGAESYVWTDR